MPRPGARRPTRLAATAAAALLALAAGGSGDPARAQSSRPAEAPAEAPAAAPETATRTSSLHLFEGAVLPPDGLLLLSLGGCLAGVDYPQDGSLFDATDRLDLRLRAEYGALPWLRLRGTLPWRSWSGPAGVLPPGGGGLADATVGATVVLPEPARDLALALTLDATLPTGARDEGLGEGKAVAQAGVAAAARIWRRGPWPELRLHLGAGRRLNPDGGRGEGGAGWRFAPWPPLYPAVPAGGGSTANDFTLLCGALELRAVGLSLYLEYAEARLPLGRGAAVREFPRTLTPGLHWGGAEGWGLSLAYEVSLARDDAATSYLPAAPDLAYHLAVSRVVALGGRDRDGDGTPDRRDACPDDPEDHDGWRDDDGCPEPDNDADGVADALDGCPDAPEDRDGFADEDGCPDEDNDADGVPDRRDACPDLAEDHDGDRDGDGCPEERRDADGDGVDDERDRCPDLTEDVDGFEDDDGCPDPDNDLDGIDDARDRCPNQAEDYNGAADDDGCPDATPPPAPDPAAPPAPR